MENAETSNGGERTHQREVLADSLLTHQDIVNGMRALREQVKPGDMSVREMIQDGRRF